jgi:phosphoenolpyruvate carboxykinase (ATP)
MASIGRYRDPETLMSITSQFRTTIETAFYRNNVELVQTPSEAYKLALGSPGTIELTGMPVYEPEKLGLPETANMLLFNDGAVYGRCAAARKISSDPGVIQREYAGILREAVYESRSKTMYHGEAIIGLHEDFMVKAHMLIPKGQENILYSWMLNFQYINEYYSERYSRSVQIPDGDIWVYSDPEWKHPDHPLGLTFFDPEHNCAAILGMRYFGEHKKGTLTLAWGTAVRNGYAACHGGLKRYGKPDGNSYTAAFFGLSGSGKSTLTHAKHMDETEVKVLHDDAFIINIEKQSSIALEPSYFDKTADYPLGHEDNKYILTLQNNGAVLAKDGKIYPATADLRNGNGRAVKSKLWSKNRVDIVEDPIDSIFWLMKDPSLPPVIHVQDPVLAAAFGATLATKRTSAEHLAPGIDPDALVIEPYANPFRTYPLQRDYEKFKVLFCKGIQCYILNTGHFLDKKVEPKHTLGILEALISGTANFIPFGPGEEGLPGISWMELSDFPDPWGDDSFADIFAARLRDRFDYLEKLKKNRGGVDQIDQEAQEKLAELLSSISTLVKI